ncbi:hypothetical protein GSI_06241 [Ganoderma sinense ZZ0214-1]|uniref:Uncharacterized protein n=1 Tax=Ganoderma sinense ZZ0214-1 TaxID=1077348 RepID=A0A2G8SCQ0_9APHY|nr:hypothetical protein GSI_06241 [Ganoderma sinense ZZ0214-1]
MPQPKQSLAHPPNHRPSPSAPGTPPRLPKRPFRLSSKNSPAPSSLRDPSSSGLLALLVTLAGSSSVDGRPFDSEIPPDFLCPRLHAHPSAQPSSSSQAPPSVYWVPCDASEAATYSDSSFPPLAVDYSARPRKKHSRRTANIADKYEQYPDGRWRKAHSWELYGSSSCAISQCMDATPTEIPVQDDQVAPSTASGSSAASTSTSAGPTLPHGWGTSKSSDDMTGIILGLSLSLALSLIAFMIGIVLWRRKRRKNATDAEKPPSTNDTASTQLSEEAQRIRSKQRMWQRASAKWLANVKHSARRRRKFGATTSSRPSDTDLLADRATIVQASASAVSLTRTQTMTDDRGSACTTPPASVRRVGSRPPRSRSLSIASSDCNANHSDADSLSPPSPHPPAYMPDPGDKHSRSHRQPYIIAYPDPRPSEVRPSVDLPADASSPSPYEAPIHSAHVATDDKTVLARIAQMASAPPPGDELSLPGASGGLSEVHPSVPFFEVDSFEALPPELEFEAAEDALGEHGFCGASTSVVTHDILSPAKEVAASSYPSRHVVVDHDMDLEVPSYTEVALRHRGPILPLPPAKVPLTGPTFYEYPNEFEDDVVTTEPLPGPSSPPFEEPSAPPFAFEDGPNGAHMIVASAPPLEVDDDEGPHIGEFLPSAPPFDVNDHLPTLDPHLARAPPDLESSTPPSGDHRNVNVDARPGAVFLGRETEYGTRTSPPRYLP